MGYADVPLQEGLFPGMEDLTTGEGIDFLQPSYSRPNPGDVFAHYQLEQVLGEGCSGVVYRAKDFRLARQVALKIVRPELQADDKGWARMLHEARMIARMNHPGLCPIHEVGEFNGIGYIVMEYVNGKLLSHEIARGPFSNEQLLIFGSQLASALGHAHQRGVLHRDVKASNIIIQPNCQLKLLDFGLAVRMKGVNPKSASSFSMLEPAAPAGTLPYLAPEVLRGERANVPSDLWALGVVLYQMASARLPFPGRTQFEMAFSILTEPPAPLPSQTDTRLASVILRCLEKDTERRYECAEMIYRDLQNLTFTPARAPKMGVLKFLMMGR